MASEVEDVDEDNEDEEDIWDAAAPPSVLKYLRLTLTWPQAQPINKYVNHQLPVHHS